MRTQPIVRFALIASVLGGCKDGGCKAFATDDPFPELGPSSCETHDCQTLENEASNTVLGAWLSLRSAGPPCAVSVMWPFWQPAVHGFEARVVAREGEVFPSHDGLVGLVACFGFVPGGRRGGPKRDVPEHATVLQDPHELASGLALASGDVFIPLNGNATLDSTFVATAQLDASDRTAASASARVTLLHQSDPPVAHPNLRPGDTFAWGDRAATLVRIVPPRPPHVAGWIEIALSSAAKETSD